jgi:hypothetical protein
MHKFSLVRKGTTCAGEFDNAASLRRVDVLDPLTSLNITPIETISVMSKKIVKARRDNEGNEETCWTLPPLYCML